MKHSGTEQSYVLVTTISTHRMRYCIPVSALQAMNTDVPIQGREIEWALDCVTTEQAQEFSQSHLGEQIVDANVLNTEQMLELFDADNEYLRSWSTQQKIDYANR
jgi:hypothetical protein